MDEIAEIIWPILAAFGKFFASPYYLLSGQSKSSLEKWMGIILIILIVLIIISVIISSIVKTVKKKKKSKK